MTKINIPFQGFYNSDYGWMIDSEEESICNGNSDLMEKLSDSINYKQLHSDIAEVYTGELSFLTELHSITFDEMTSPSYYNFETDRIFASIDDDDDIEKMFRAIDKEDLRQLILDSYTSYDGFISFYSNNLEEWFKEPVIEWDCNQLGTLLTCYLNQLDSDWERTIQDKLYEPVSNAIYEHSSDDLAAEMYSDI